MMITWQSEYAFQDLGEYFSKPRFPLVFRGNRVRISRRQESFGREGGGGRNERNLPWIIFGTASVSPGFRG